MAEVRCCPECFGDSGLRRNIIPLLEPPNGICSYCGSIDVPLVLPTELRQWFEVLIDVYEVSTDGRPLSVWLREDWRLFENRVMDDEHVEKLLADILDDAEIVRRLFVPSPQYEAPSLVGWDELRDELMHRNRWFLDRPLDLDRLRELLDLLITMSNELSTTWFRARLMEDDEVFPLEKMGAPPHRLAGHGRANPAGIPYLYLGSTPQTAVSEIRPYTGDSASVAEFAIPSVRTVDLREPRRQVSPFLLTDAGEIGQLRADLPLLERLGFELTRPVLPRGAAFEYIPSQYLCEFIKVSGFDGVVYRSSVSDGINMALFAPDSAVGRGVAKYRVERVEIQVTPSSE